jgi:hypothetical protein
MVGEGLTKVSSELVEGMKSTPLAIALLAVNITFLGFAAFVLYQVGTNASIRDKAQSELIAVLVKDCRK